MPDNNEATLAEIHKLIDEQMESLKGKLTPQEAAQYGRRKQRIDQLLMRLSLNGVKVE